MTNFDYQDVTLYNKAVWNCNSHVEFYFEGGYSGRIAKPGDVVNIGYIEAIRLRDLLHSKIDFLKLDIEGAEIAVLKDCRDCLGNINNIFIEYHSHISERQELAELLSILTENQFRYQIKEAYGSLHPFMDRQLMCGMDMQLNIFAYKY